jgi:glycosyltransferase involved in cell wall biosynthesis
LRILFVLNVRYNKSGITEQVLYLKKCLQAENYEVKLVSTFGNIFYRIKGIVNAVKEGSKSDLIIGVGCSYFGFYPIFVAALAAFFLNKKIIYNYHGGQAEKFLWKYNYLLKHIFRKKKIVVASDYLKSVFSNFGYNFVKIDNFFDFTSFPKMENQFKWNKKVIWARSFEPLYQPELALEIAENVTKNYDCEFHFYGDGSLLDKLRKKYENEKIIFHGLVDREEFLKEYRNYSVYLNTTLNDNIPNTIFEAGFYDLLVVSSKVGGIETTFSEKEILFVKNNSKEDYIKILSNIFNNPDSYNSIRRELNRKIMNYDWDNVRLKWLTIINQNKY